MFRKLFNLFSKNSEKLEAKSLSSLLSKEGRLPMDDILEGKYKNLIVEKKSGHFDVSIFSPKTDTETIFSVTPSGKLLKKETILGAGNSATDVMHSNNILYSGSMKDGHTCVVPTRWQINYTVPYYKGKEKGFSDTRIMTPRGWVKKHPTPFNNF